MLSTRRSQTMCYFSYQQNKEKEIVSDPVLVTLMWICVGRGVWVCGLVFMVMMVRLFEVFIVVRMGITLNAIL